MTVLQFQTAVFIFRQLSSFLDTQCQCHDIPSFSDSHLHFYTVVFIFKMALSLLDSRLHFQTVVFIFRQSSSHLDSCLHFQTVIVMTFLHFLTVIFISKQSSYFQTIAFSFRQLSSVLDSQCQCHETPSFSGNNHLHF